MLDGNSVAGSASDLWPNRAAHRLQKSLGTTSRKPNARSQTAQLHLEGFGGWRITFLARGM